MEKAKTVMSTEPQMPLTSIKRIPDSANKEISLQLTNAKH